jgi:16S rRNA (adenine1518-N6/adenine1519-N6)-dimethyltransferase
MTAPRPSPRQTLSYIRNLFQERGIKPKNKLGQNFLIDLNLLDVLLEAAALGPEDLVLEVGSGTGSLTVRLAQLAGAVVTVEVGPAFAAITADLVHGRDNVVALHADVLENKNEINSQVFAATDELARRRGTQHFKLVANLPYAVAVPVLSNLLLSDHVPELMVGTVQWEIAERLKATVGSKEYGALAVLVQSVADVELVRRLPPAAFWPRPLVWSAIVRIRPSAAKRGVVGDVRRFRTFLRDLYAHRRKNLRGALLGLHGRPFTKAEVDQRLAALGIDGTLRAESLGLEEHLRLCGGFQRP